MNVKELRWSEGALDDWRNVGDPEADRVAEEMEERGAWASINRVLHSMQRNDSPAPADLPAPVRAYFEDTLRMPTWADAGALARAQEVFARQGPWIILALHCASLPYSYGAAKGVKVLHFTGKLHRHPRRRLLNTAQFVVDVMSPGSFGPDGHAIRSAQKVRLLHAAVRGQLARNDQWEAPWGMPLNQEDLAGTLLCFSWIALEALPKMGISVRPDDVDAYLHAWRVAGALLGIDNALLADGAVEHARLKTIIERRQLASSTEGHVLTSSLVEYLDGLLNPPGIRGIPAALIRLFLGDRVGDLLGVAEPARSRLVRHPLRLGAMLVNRAMDRAPLLARAPEVLGRRLLERMCRPEHASDRAHFEIPETLQRRWATLGR